MPDTVIIVTGESSGELYGSLLSSALKKKIPGLRIVGIGGDKMLAAGVELMAGISSAFGITEAFSSLKTLRHTFLRVKNALHDEKPSLLILIDFPDFNLRLAHHAKSLNIPVLYYVSPQIWAWRRYRLRKIVRLVNKMAVILPFEEEIYKNALLDCEFVGHPAFDEIQDLRTEKKDLRKAFGLRPDSPIIALLPGSRPHELKTLLPVMLDVVKDAQKQFDDVQFCIPFAPNTNLELYHHFIAALKDKGVLITQGQALRVLAASDYAVVASGTASLQAVLLGVPTVIIYKIFPLTYLLGKLLIRLKHIGLVNILSGKTVVKELLQSQVTSQNIVAELTKMMQDATYRSNMMEAFAHVRNMFTGKRASERVAEIAIQIITSNRERKEI